jgi:hypothetical protein
MIAPDVDKCHHFWERELEECRMNVVVSVGEEEGGGLFVVASVEGEGEVQYFCFCHRRDKLY